MKQMLEKMLGEQLYTYLENRYLFSKIYELRIRNGKPIIINYNGDFQAVLDSNRCAVVADKALIQRIILVATGQSLYSHNDQLKQGFITSIGGIRIGVSGEIVYNEKNEVSTIRNFTGLTIRLPHAVRGCADCALQYIVQDNKSVLNTLLISKPGCGKTTILREIAKNLSDRYNVQNILIVDERYEIADCVNGVPQFDIGKYTDVVSGASKAYGFREGVRSARPNVILCDELSCAEDSLAVINACNSGVKVIASVHADTKEELLQKEFLKPLINSGVIQRYIFLTDVSGVGTYRAIYDGNLRCVYCGE